MDQVRPLIIKKKKVAGGDGHHGGAWKVAYADFVTAMMAFFLLMWLLNATSEDQRKGLADYFDPSIPISRSSAGGAGMLGGDTALAPPEAASTRTEGERPKPTHKDRGEDLGDKDKSPPLPEDGESINTGTADIGSDPNDATAGQAELSAEGEDQAELDAEGDGQAQLANVADTLFEQVAQAGQDGLMQHFNMRMTPEGLVIEIVDLQGDPLFGSGSAKPEPVLQTLIDILVPVIAQTSNDLAVVGHTDATPFSNASGYSNWELSADRANAARRLLIDSGLAQNRITRISGKAATDPIYEDPNEPRNRRIAVTLLRATAN